MAQIKNTIVGFGTVELEQLENIQGNLKVLTDTGYQKLKTNIIKNGFDSVFYVWKSKTKTKTRLRLLDGVQRLDALKRMKEEGYQLPELKAVFIKAKDLAEAKQRMTSYLSQFGEFTQQGIDEFLTPMKVEDMTQIMGSAIDLKDIEVNIDDFFKHGTKEKAEKHTVCPKCGYVFE